MAEIKKNDTSFFTTLDELTQAFLESAEESALKSLIKNKPLEYELKDTLVYQMHSVKYNVMMRNIIVPALVRARRTQDLETTEKLEDLLKTLAKSTALVNDTQRMLNETKNTFIGQNTSQVREKIREALVDIGLDDSLPEELQLKIMSAVMK